MSRYYIIKPKSHSVQQKIIDGIRHIDKEAVIVESFKECDTVIMQHGWTRSKSAIKEYEEAGGLGKRRKESDVYVTFYTAQANKGQGSRE